MSITHLHIQRYLITGLLVVLPLWVTYLIFDFLLTQLAKLGRPSVKALANAIEPQLPSLAAILDTPWFETSLAVLGVVLFLYVLGWATTKVIGKKLLGYFERLVSRIPLIEAVYGAVKKLLDAFGTKPTGESKSVVLIEFPNPGMKTVGFITSTMKDEVSGAELAVVYVPTTPNPTSGYMEIVPMEKVTRTNWTLDEAMSFVVTGGTSSPASVHYSQSAKAADTAVEKT
jgi:uncharacterized membrane protein